MASMADSHPIPAAVGGSSGPMNKLARMWRARGFFGGLIAIALAAWGQQTLITQGDTEAAGRLYVAAIIILIASLFHPRLPKRKSRAGDDLPPGPSGTIDESSAPAATHPIRGQTAGATTAPMIAYAGPSNSHNNSRDRGLMRHALPSRTVSERQAGTLSDAATTTVDPAVRLAAPPPTAWPPAPQVPVKQGQIEGRASTLDRVEQTTPSRLGALGRRLNRRIALAGMALTLLLSGAAAFVLQQGVTDPLGGWLWAAALVALIATSIGAFLGLRGVSLLRGPQSDFFTRGVPNIPRRWEALLIGGTLVVSLALRLVNLEYMPGIFGDEGERGMDARAINEGNPAFLFGYGWWGVPNLYFYLVSFMLRVFGDNMVGDRMLSVISGVVAVWFAYRIGRLLWGARAGLIAGAMLAVSPLALQFSRLAGESTPTGTLWIAGAYFFFMALRHLRWSDWALAGITWGFSLYFYAAGKLIIPIIALLGAYCVARWHKDFFKRYALGFVLLLFGFGLTFMPYAIFSIQETPAWQGFTGRAQETSIFSPQNQPQAFIKCGIPYDPSRAAQPLAQNVLSQPLSWAHLIFQQMRVTTEVIYRTADPTPFYQIREHGGSMLAPLWAAIAMLGLAYAAWKSWDARYGLLSIMFWGGMLGAALTMDIPSVQRLTGAWPALMLFPAALLDRVFAAAWPLNMQLARRGATLPLAGLMLFFAADSYREYFGHYAALCPYCDATTQARYVQDLGQEYKGYQLGVGDYLYFFSYGSTRFVAKDVEGADLSVPADYFPITDNNGKGAAFLVYSHNAQYLPLIRLFYPGGKEEVIKSQDGVERFTSYKLTREQMAASQTSHATYTPDVGSPVARDEPSLGTERTGWAPPPGITYPASAIWQGGLVAPTYSTYTFQVDGPDDAQLEIDGRNFPLAASGAGSARQARVVLAEGLHAVRLSGTLSNLDSRLGLRWAGLGSAAIPIAIPIEARYLYKGTTGGLSGEVAPLLNVQLLNSPDPLGGQTVISRRNDPFFGFREATDAFSSAPFVVRWRGSLDTPSTGDYAFDLQATGATLLRIDGKLVVNTSIGGPPSGTLPLSAGSHTVEMLYAWQGGPGRMEWYWTSPGGKRQLVPPTVLSSATRSWLPSELPNPPVGVALELQQQSTEVAPKTVIGEGAGLSNPRGLGVDGSGNIYVGDNGNGRIVVFSGEGKVLRTWGNKGSEQSLQPREFLDIVDVAVSKEGIVAVSDFKARRLQLFDREGKSLAVFDATALTASGPNGVSFSDGGDIYIADTVSSKLLKLALAPDYTIKNIETIPIEEAQKLEQCLDVAVDASGRVYGVDLKNRIIRVDASGAITNYALPVGTAEGGSRLAVSPDGSIVYMSDPDRQRVAALDTAEGVVTYFGAPGTGPGRFGQPTGIAAGRDGRVYVLDSVNNNIQVFTLDK